MPREIQLYDYVLIELKSGVRVDRVEYLHRKRVGKMLTVYLLEEVNGLFYDHDVCLLTPALKVLYEKSGYKSW